MAIVDDVTGAVLVVIIFLAGSLLLIQGYARAAMEKDNFMRQESIEKDVSSILDAALQVAESGTQRSFGDLLGSVAYYRNDLVNTPEDQANISERFDVLLRTMMPDDSYYFEAEPGYKSVELIFIVDGSDSMRDEMSYLASNMDRMLAETRDLVKLEVTSRVYVLNTLNSSWCGSLSPCSYLGPDDIYFNRSYTAFDLKKHKYGLMPPSHLEDEEEVWKSDWETAMAMLMITTENSDLSEVKIMVPFTDGLPGATRYLHPCPTSYSMQIFQRDFQLIKRFNFIFDPVLSSNSDPVMYCDKEIMRHMGSLIYNGNGQVMLNRDNLAKQLPQAVKGNLDSMKVRIGREKKGKTYSAERKLPMPNGELATATLQVYSR